MKKLERRRDGEVLILEDVYSDALRFPEAALPANGSPPLLEALHMDTAVPKTRSPAFPAPLLQKFERTLALSRAHELPVTFVGYRPLFSEPQFYTGREQNWVVMPIEKDPMLQRYNGRFYAPAEVITTLQRIVDAGVDFDALYIAHEFPKDVPPERWEEAVLPAAHPGVRRRLETLERWTHSWWKTVAQFTAGMVAVSALAASALSVVAFTADVACTADVAFTANVAFTVDPILLGVLTDKEWVVDGRPMGMWFYLSHWRWPVEQGTSSNK